MASKPYNKYGNIKKTIDGIVFDSLVESQYYEKLKKDELLGNIKMFKTHVPFVLQESYQLPGERKMSAIKYNADFFVVYPDGSVKVIDVKGGDTTPEFKLKKKMFEYHKKMKLWEVRKQGLNWIES